MTEFSQKQVRLHPRHLINERKFDIALRKSHSLEFKNRILSNNLSVDDKLLMYSLEKQEISLDVNQAKINFNLYPCVLREVLRMQIHHQSIHRSHLRRVLNLTLKNFEIQMNWNNQDTDPQLKMNIEELKTLVLTRYNECKEISSLLFIKDHFDTIINSLPIVDNRVKMKKPFELTDVFEFKSKHNYYHIKPLDLKMVWSRMTLIIQFDDEVYILPRVYILLMHNKVCDLLSTSFFCICVHPSIYESDNLWKDVLAVVKELISLSIRYKDNFFHIVKVLEALVVGETLIKLEGVENDIFLKNLSDGLIESANFEYNGSMLQELLQSFSIPLMNEMGSLSKILGHPFCDLKKGAEDLFTKTHETLELVPEAILQSVRFSKLEFIKNYIFRHHKWPPIEGVDELPEHLKVMINKNMSPGSSRANREFGNFNVKDMDFITLGKVLEFDYVENIIPFLKDKTITLYRNDVFRKVIQQDKSFKHDWKKTRLLIIYLICTEEQLDHIGYIKQYCQGDWDEIQNYLVFRIVPKEKELKPTGRGFGCKTALDRMRGTVQEINTANFLNKYCHEEVMTLTELDIVKKMYGFRHLDKVYPGYTSIIINVDASAWNNRFRDQTVNPVCKETLDNIFGIPIFSKTMQAFEHSFIYYPDINSVESWDGQLGGIEGQNQYTWVWVYLNQLRVWMDGFPYPYHVLCKGDDLRICIMVPPQLLQTTTIANIKKEVLTQISDIAKSFNHRIKVEDSYASHLYFAFSKDAYAKQIQLPLTFKKIQKSYGANNSYLNTIDDYVASTFSNGHSASKLSATPFPCFLVSNIWCYLGLIYNDYYCNLNDDQLVALCLVPNLFGGFPIIYLHNYFVRAESDLLPPFIDLLKFTSQYYPSVHNYMYKFTVCNIDSIDKSFRGFLSDPYGLPIRKPQLPQSFIKQELSRLIRKKVKNEKILELFNVADSDEHQQLLNALQSSNVYNGKLFSAIYDASPLGVIESIISKFESGRSVFDVILNMTGERRAYQMLRRCYNLDRRRHMYRLQILSDKLRDSNPLLPSNFTSLCPVKVSQNLRDWLWGKPVESVTTTHMQHLISVGRIDYFNPDQHVANNHFECYLNFNKSNTEIMTKRNLIFSTGDKKPFLGGSTGTGLSAPQLSIHSSNIMTAKISSLMAIYKWSMISKEVNGVLLSSNIHKLIESLLKIYTGLEIDDIMPFSGTRIRDRTIQHHVRSRQYKVSIVPNTLLNLFTRVEGNSHSHRFLEMSPHHYSFNYLHAYCHTLSITFQKLWAGDMDVSFEGRIWSVTNPCTHCFTPIEETPIIVPNPSIPLFNYTHLTKVGQEAINEVTNLVDACERPIYFLNIEDLASLTLHEARLSIIQYYNNNMWLNLKNLQDRYTNHVLTSEGIGIFQDLLGSTHVTQYDMKEISLIPPEIIFQDFSLVVFSYCNMMFKDINIHNALTRISSIPSEQLPWAGFIKELQQHNLLYSIVRHTIESYPTLKNTVYDNWLTYVPVFGTACFYESLKRKMNPHIAYITYQQLEQTQQMLINRLTVIIGLSYRSMIIPLIRASLRDYQLLGRQNYLNLLVHAVLTSLVVNPKFYTTTDKKDINFVANESRYLKVNIFQLTDDPVEFVVNNRDNIDDLGPLFRILSETFPEHDWQNIVNHAGVMYEQMFYDNYDSALATVLPYQLTIFRTDPTAASNIIRYHAMQDHRYNPVTFMDMKKISFIQERSIKMKHGSWRNSSKLSPHMEVQAFGIPQTINDDEYHFDDFWSDENLMNLRWLNRPLGSSNISISKFLNIFNIIGIKKLPSNNNYLCLADGYGGGTAIINSMTTDSLIVFNTFPNVMQQTSMPLVAMTTFQDHNNVIDNSLLEAGYYDLSLNKTWEVISQISDKYLVIICDIEFVKKDYSFIEETTLKILLSFKYLLYDGGLGIFKCYLKYPKLIEKMIGIIGPYSLRMELVRSDASALNSEVYLIAIRSSVPYSFVDWNPGSSSQYTTAKNQLKVKKLCDYYNHLINTDHQGVQELILTDMGNQQLAEALIALPWYGLSKLQEVAKVPLKQPTTYFTQKDKADYILDLSNITEMACKTLISEICNQSMNIDVQRDVYNTLAHRVILICRLIIITGFTNILNMVLIKNVVDDTLVYIMTIHQDAIITGYESLMHTVFTDYIHFPDFIPHIPELRYEYEISDKSYAFYKYYQLGSRWAINVLHNLMQI